MSHVRKQIRDRVVTELSGLTTTGQRVHNTRYFPLSPNDLPCLLVYPDDGVAEESEHDGELRLSRELRMVVRGVAQAQKNVEDKLDTIAAEVETAMSRTLNDLAVNSMLAETRILRSNEGDHEIASVELVFAVLYRTALGAPEAAL